MKQIAAAHDAIFGQACGVVAARLAVDLDTAAGILERVAKRERVRTSELAADVVASCADSTVYLPRVVSTNDELSLMTPKAAITPAAPMKTKYRAGARACTRA
jgi:hypothetical protein